MTAGLLGWGGVMGEECGREVWVVCVRVEVWVPEWGWRRVRGLGGGTCSADGGVGRDGADGDLSVGGLGKDHPWSDAIGFERA